MLPDTLILRLVAGCLVLALVIVQVGAGHAVLILACRPLAGYRNLSHKPRGRG
jgi:hypothetical protein